MKKYFFLFIILLSGIAGVYVLYSLGTGRLYSEYMKLWEYRRMHPETLPDPVVADFFVAGNQTTYADTLWINLIQYIADNLRNDEYKGFLNPIIERITTLHPHFTEPYNLALILAPKIKQDSVQDDGDREIIKKAISLGERGLTENCDTKIMNKIRSMAYTSALWEDSSISNPCQNDMIAYNLGFLYNEIGERDKAEEAYKLASAQKSGPEVARLLAVLSHAKEGDHLLAAEKFLLIAASGYDEEPFECNKKSVELIRLIKTNTLDTAVKYAESIEPSIESPKNTKNPLSSSSTNCHASITRGIKQLYLEYLKIKGASYPDGTKSAVLIEKGVISHLPTLKDQKGWFAIKEKGIWKYRESIYDN